MDAKREYFRKSSFWGSAETIHASLDLKSVPGALEIQCLLKGKSVFA